MKGTMPKTKRKVQVRSEYCKGCGLCIEYCKKGVLKYSKELNRTGYHYATPDEAAECSGCLICTLVCPEVIIEVLDE